MKQLNSFLSVLKAAYAQQGQTGRILIPGAALLVLCCLCSLVVSLLPLGGRNSAGVTPSPFVFPTQGNAPTPTALFNYGGATFTPFPTLPAPTAFPTFTAPATATETPTQTTPTATATLIPTPTALPPTASHTGAVVILAVNKPAEYVDLQNTGAGPVDLSGWKLVSRAGNQSCTLSGILEPSAVLRVWSGKGDSGLSCGYAFNIWNDNSNDPAVLYDAQGKEVSRYP